MTVSGTISTTGNGGISVSDCPGAGHYAGGGGGGAGGSIKIVGNNLDLGAAKVTSAGAAGGSGCENGTLGATNQGGTGGSGRIAVYNAGTISGSTNPTYTVDSSVADFNPYKVFTSKEIATPGAVSLDTIAWTENLPSGTEIQLQTRSGATSNSLDGTWQQWRPQVSPANRLVLESADIHTNWVGTSDAVVAEGDVTRNVDYFEDEDELDPTNITKISPLNAAVQIESYEGVTAGNISTFSGAVTVPAAANLAVVILGTGNQIGIDPAVTSITLGGTGMTQAVRVSNSNRSVDIWYLANPPTGTPTLSVTWAASEYHRIDLETFSGTANSPIKSVNSSTGSGTTNTLSISAPTNGFLVEAVVNADNTTVITPNSGQTERVDTDIFSTRYGLYDKVGPQDNVQLTFGNAAWAHAAIAIQPQISFTYAEATPTGSPVNISSYRYLTFWVRASVAGSSLKFGFGETVATEQEESITIYTANIWQKYYWDISDITGTARDAVTKLRLTNLTTASNTVYLDNVTADVYLTTSTGSTITSTANSYIQYRAILTTTSVLNTSTLSEVRIN